MGGVTVQQLKNAIRRFNAETDYPVPVGGSKAELLKRVEYFNIAVLSEDGESAAARQRRQDLAQMEREASAMLRSMTEEETKEAQLAWQAAERGAAARIAEEALLDERRLSGEGNKPTRSDEKRHVQPPPQTWPSARAPWHTQ